MDGLSQTLKSLGTVRLALMGAVGVGLVAFFIFLTARLNTTDMSLLYGDLQSNDSAKITAKLEQMGIEYKLEANGQQIFVPSENTRRIRMTMAEEGLPSDGSVGYEIFDRSEALGTTNFVQNVNLLRALEGELSRTIKSLQQVREARVHIVLPKRELFSRRKQEPSASVVVKTSGQDRLPKAQVMSIQHLIAAAVPGLKPERISIIDHRGRLLARAGAGEEADDVVPTEVDELRLTHERRLATKIEEMLEKSVGIGRVRANVAVEMDFDRISTNTESYDPDGQVVRSTQTVEESSKSADNDQEAVTVQNNLPEGQATEVALGSVSESERTEETVNYEISKVVKTHIRETGLIRKLSVAVLIDGTYTKDEEGNEVYEPRNKEELDQLAALVRTAVGYDEKRGDQVELINMRFTVQTEKLEGAEPLFGLTKSDYFRIGEIFVLAIVGILVILLVVRPLVARTLDALPSALEAAKEATLLSDQSADSPALTGPGGAGVSGALGDEEDSMIDLDLVEGRVKASTLKKISEIVERHPEETVGIIRQWMYSES